MKRASLTLDSERFIQLDIEHLPEGYFLATSADLPGLLAQGRSVAETMTIAQDVARKIIESHIAHGDPLPPMRRRRMKRMAVLVPVTVSQ